jgi:PAS domain S-box-containing protein
MSGDAQPIPVGAIEAYLELARKVNVLMREDEVLRVFVDMLARLFPGRLHCLRLLDERRGQLVEVLADGHLDDETREKVFVSPAAFEEGRVPEGVLANLPEGVEVVEAPPLVFRGTEGGAVVALADEVRLFGTMHVEWTGDRGLGPGERLLVFALGHHLTSAIRATRLLNESMYLRDYLSKLIDNANAPIVIVDGKRRVMTINRHLERLTGFDRKELTGTDFLDLFEAKDRQRFVPVIIKATRGLATSNFETRIPRKGGGEAQIAFNITSVLDKDGKVEAVIAVGQDLTEIRRLQNQMLHSERLVTIGELSAGVVHEINNPLTSISVYSEYLLKGAEAEGAQPETIKRLQRINQASQRIFQFTQQLMAYARPTGDEPTLVDVVEVLNKSIGFCEHIVRKASVTVKREFGEDLAPVYGIEGQLEQVFVNLITNACHAMRHGGGKLTLRVERRHEGMLSIDVSDEGEGIAPESIKDIFEPFYTTKSEGEGTGLGLSIVKNIITSHEGDIGVRSVPGKGTTFTVTLYTSE